MGIPYYIVMKVPLMKGEQYRPSWGVRAREGCFPFCGWVGDLGFSMGGGSLRYTYY
jgi:hypothetical protein